MDNLSLPYGTGKLREKVDVVAARDTEIITINVTDPIGLAAAIANEVADAFMKEVVAIGESGEREPDRSGGAAGGW